MTRLNFTFQEASPLITYSAGGWVEGSAANDSLSAKYDGSFRVTFTTGATATFSFSGTAVSLFGANRPNHGNYTVALDQQPLFTANGAGNNLFNHSLWHADNLGFTKHTVTFTNVPTGTGNFADLDFMSIERQIGQDGDTIFQAAIDDAKSPLVQYDGAWSKTNGDNTAHKGTLSSTTAANAKVAVTFQGCCIELYGKYANARYTVVVNGQQPIPMRGLDVDLAPNFQHPQTLLYLVDGLSETGNHTVTLTNTDSNVNRPFSFDYALVSSTHDISSIGSQAPLNGDGSGSGSGQPGSDTTNSPPVGAIVGGVVGGLFIVSMLVLGLLLIRRRRRRRADPAFPLDLIDDELKPYILPGQSEAENGSHRPESAHRWSVPPLLTGTHQDSKSRAQMTFYPRGGEPVSEEGLLSPQERSAASGSGSGSYGRTNSTATAGHGHETSGPMSGTSDPRSGTSGSRSGTSGSRSGGSGPRSGTSSSRSDSTSWRRRRRDTKTPSSPRGAGESSRIEEPAVQEEDAGVVLEPEEEPVARTLPPAYNPEWDRG